MDITIKMFANKIPIGEYDLQQLKDSELHPVIKKVILKNIVGLRKENYFGLVYSWEIINVNSLSTQSL